MECRRSTIRYLMVIASIQMVLAMPVGLYAQPTPSDISQVLKLNDVTLAEFKAKTLDNVDRLSLYIRTIADKQQQQADKELAISLALKLFVNQGDGVIVEVSSLNRATIRRYGVEEYFRRLQRLKYSRVEITWAKIYFVSQFEKAPDGNYYGVVSIAQRFVGYGADGGPLYEDLTVKNIKVSIRPIDLDMGPEKQREWEVMLSDIQVTETRAR